ncbi:MAG: transposase, partial [Ignavibacteria bacterium]
MKGQVVMSHKELDRVKIMNELIKGKLSKYEAQELLAISIRQLYRLLAIYQAEGDTGMIHGLRGKKSNSGYSKEVKNKVISLYRSQYNDYGPTLFSEKLIEYHNLNINRETIRLWLRSEAVCTGMRKKRAHRKRRERRTGF